MKSSTKHDGCQVCGDTTGKCRVKDRGTPGWLCMTYVTYDANVAGYKKVGESKDGGTWGVYVEISEDEASSRGGKSWDEVQADKRKREEAARDREVARGAAMSVDERSGAFRRLIGELDLSVAHKNNLIDRGLNELEIKFIGFRSVAPYQKLKNEYPAQLPGIGATGKKLDIGGAGFLCPAYNWEGQLLGFQTRFDDATGGKYKWVGSVEAGNGSKLPNEEMPLSVWRQSKPTKIVLCEGFLKAAVASYKSGDIYIGAAGGNFRSVEKQLKEAIEKAIAAFPALRDEIHIAPDAGNLANGAKNITGETTLSLLMNWGYAPKVLWWEQGSTKAHGDIDEIDLSIVRSIDEKEYRVKLHRAAANNTAHRLGRATLPPTVTLNKPDISDLPLPQTGAITAVSSACKTGKTQALVNWVKQHQALYPNGKILLLGYRNALLKQTCIRTGIEHIQDLGVDGRSKLTRQYINSAKAIALCIDSLGKLDVESIAPNTLVIFDEAEAIAKHLLEGGTLGSEQGKIAAHFHELMCRVMQLGGMTAMLEDNLTDLSLFFFQKVCSIQYVEQYPIHYYLNQYQASHWDVEVMGGSKSGFIDRLLGELAKGKKIFLPTTSQGFGEVLERIVRDRLPSLKVVRLDRKTIELKELRLHALMESPDEWLEMEAPDLFILSPTGESGVSVWVPLFDEVWAYCANLDTRAQIQMLERYRLEVPRKIFCSEFLQAGECDEVKLAQVWNRNALKTLRSADGDTADIEQKIEASKFWNSAAAGFKARENASLKAMRLGLIATLEKRGHKLIETKIESNDKIGEEYRAHKLAIELEDSAARSAADESKAADKKSAELILKDPESGEELRNAAHKRLYMDRLPGVEMTTEFIHKAFIHKKGELLKGTELWYYVTHIEDAALRDWLLLNSIEKSQSPIVFTAKWGHWRSKAELLAGIAGLIELVEANGEYCESDPQIGAMATALGQNAGAIYRLFGLHIKGEDTVITTCNKIFKKLGLKPEVARKEGGRGKQTRIYRFSSENQEVRQQILEALERKVEQIRTEIESKAIAEKKDEPTEIVDEISVTPPIAEVSQPIAAISVGERRTVREVGYTGSLYGTEYAVLVGRVVEIVKPPTIGLGGTETIEVRIPDCKFSAISSNIPVAWLQ